MGERAVSPEQSVLRNLKSHSYCFCSNIHNDFSTDYFTFNKKLQSKTHVHSQRRQWTTSFIPHLWPHLLLCCSSRRCSGQSQSPSHDASPRQRAHRGSAWCAVNPGSWDLSRSHHWAGSPCSSTAPYWGAGRSSRELLSSPGGFSPTTWRPMPREGAREELVWWQMNVIKNLWELNSLQLWCGEGTCCCTWSVWGEAWGLEAVCGPSAVSELRSEWGVWMSSAFVQLQTTVRVREWVSRQQLKPNIAQHVGKQVWHTFNLELRSKHLVGNLK